MASDPNAVLKAIASPIRMQILQELGFHDMKARVSDLAEALGMAPNSVSYHLKELSKAGVVEKIPTPEGRDARETWYTVAGGGVQVEVEKENLTGPIAELVDQIYAANQDTGVVSKYRAQALRDPDARGEAVSMLSVFRLSADERDDLRRGLDELFEQARQHDIANRATLDEDRATGATATEDTTRQVFVNLDYFPVARGAAGEEADDAAGPAGVEIGDAAGSARVEVGDAAGSAGADDVPELRD